MTHDELWKQRRDALPSNWQEHFFLPSEHQEKAWKPYCTHRALAPRVLVAAKSRVEMAWAAYVDIVPGLRHDQEWSEVLSRGCKLEENVARALFPEFDGVPFAH